jgi:hypothetical protein
VHKVVDQPRLHYDVRSTNHQDAAMYQTFIVPYLYEAQHVSGDTLPIIRSLKLHWQPLVVRHSA